MTNIKAVFFDIDGTMIDSSTHIIPQSNIDAVNALQAKGIKCFVCSGRQYNMLQTMRCIENLYWDGFICNNGAAIHDREGNLINSTYFSIQQVEALIKFCEEEKMSLYLSTMDKSIAPFGCDKYMIEAHAFFDEPLPDLIKPYQKEDIIMALVYNKMDYEFTKVNTIDGLLALPNKSTYADVILKSINKATGIQQICNALGINKDETLAFGDASNDLEMLEYVEIGVAMGNASDDVKAIANYITYAVDKEGIMSALKHFKII